MKVGIIGAGNIACKMATALNGLDDTVVAYGVASRDLIKAEEFAKKWGFQKAYGSYEELVKDSEIDLVYIATPHSFHFEQAWKGGSLRKGIYYECETGKGVDSPGEREEVAAR